LIAGGLILIVTLAGVAVAPGQLIGTGASTVTWLGAAPAGRLLVGLVQVAFVAGHLLAAGRTRMDRPESVAAARLRIGKELTVGDQ
jgi:hypothetical protein